MTTDKRSKPYIRQNFNSCVQYSKRLKIERVIFFSFYIPADLEKVYRVAQWSVHNHDHT